MATIDGKLKDILTKWHPEPKKAVWDCHGKWIAYHAALEVIARNAGISFDSPVVLEANGPAKCAALCVTGTMGDSTEWSIGEAAPTNNKNAYPFAMAEKRAKDRVILKLIGLHGEVYSEEEADDFKGGGPAPNVAPTPADHPGRSFVEGALSDIAAVKTADALTVWADANKGHIKALPDDLQSQLRDAWTARMKQLKTKEAA